jgi:hypothetical protein
VPAKKIGDFLIDLGEDEALQRAYERNARKGMKDYGLDNNQQEILMRQDLQQVRASLQQENPGKEVFVALYRRPVH